MSTTIEDIQRWGEVGFSQGNAYMVVVCDTFDWEDFPVYVKPGEDLRKEHDKHNGPNMEKVMEVYVLTEDGPQEFHGY
jgi:hypothetical protein